MLEECLKKLKMNEMWNREASFRQTGGVDIEQQWLSFKGQSPLIQLGQK